MTVDLSDLLGFRVLDEDDDDPVLFDRKSDAYTAAKEAMLATTNTPEAPWTIVKSNDEKRARLEAMRWVPARFPYTDRDSGVVGEPDGRVVGPPSVVHEVGEHVAEEAPSVA